MKTFNFDEALIALQSDLLGFAYKLTADKHDAEDLLQETMLKALDNKDKFDPGTNFKGWMYIIMRNAFINNYRIKKSQGDLYILSEPDYHFLLRDDSFAFIDNSQDAKEIRAALKTLPKEHYNAFMLYISGFKYREIAQETGVSLGTIKSRIFHSRKKLKQLQIYNKYGVIMNNKYIGILTSGGDASGMNAAIRAVTRTAIFNGFKIKGIYRGYEGLIAGEVKELTTEDVSSIIQRGGTILKTARSEAFTTPEGRKKAYEVIQKENISALIIIGGDGSLTGARIFAEEYNVTCIGLPGTIDNDLYGTDFTIGYDTALNTIVECVDKIRDTATSHDRIFFVEVMGRDAGFLAQNSAIASGAEAAIIPEDKTDVDQLETFIGRGFRKTKNSSVVIVTESPQNKNGGAMYYADRVKKEYPEYDVRVSILGHLQRGGAPSANDRILASRLGEAAIQALMEDQQNVMIGIRNNEIVYVPFAQAIKNDKPIDKSLIRVLNELSI